MRKKKRKIVNQILLYNLWYIGQIHTIPKFIKEDIAKSIAQLSISKSGLILGIDTQLNTQLKLKGIKRLLNRTNALWKGLMLY